MDCPSDSEWHAVFADARWHEASSVGVCLLIIQRLIMYTLRSCAAKQIVILPIHTAGYLRNSAQAVRWMFVHEVVQLYP